MSLPPGLETFNNVTHSSSGGTEPWANIKSTKAYTNVFVFDGDKVLLGYKKRGFGQGLWNGFGGKVEPEETSIAAAARELEEESGITAPLVHCGTLLFTTADVPTAFHIEYYRADSYSGIPTETDEMRPAWHTTHPTPKDGLPVIPYAQMWPDDEYWFPILLEHKNFVGRADFDLDANGKQVMRRYWFGVKSS